MLNQMPRKRPGKGELVIWLVSQPSAATQTDILFELVIREWPRKGETVLLAKFF